MGKKFNFVLLLIFKIGIANCQQENSLTNGDYDIKKFRAIKINLSKLSTSPI